MKIITRIYLTLSNKRCELGIGTTVSVALAIIIAGFVLIPGLRAFAEAIMESMNTWWNETVKSGIFPSV
jgi:hypothetical protein